MKEYEKLKTRQDHHLELSRGIVNRTDELGVSLGISLHDYYYYYYYGQHQNIASKTLKVCNFFLL